MGWFSSKTKINVDVINTVLIEDKRDFITDAVLRSSMGPKSIGDNLLEASTGGFFSSVNQYYNRGNSSEAVTFPRARSLSGSASENDLKSAVTQYAGEAVVIEDIQTSGPAASLIAPYQLDLLYGFDLSTKKTDLPIDPESDEDYDAEYYFLGAVFEFSIETFEYNQLVIDYQKVTADSQTTNHTLEILLPDVSEDEVFLYVEFYALEDPEYRKRIWAYEMSTERYSGIEMYSAYQAHNYLPVVPIRRNKENLIDRKGTEAFKQYNWMMSKLGLDLEVLSDAIMNEDEGNDPDQMEEVFLHFVADIASDDPRVKKYLWEYFNDLSNYQYQTKQEFESWLDNRTYSAPINLIEIMDDEFKYALAFNYIEVEDIYDYSYSSMFDSEAKPGSVDTRIDVGAAIERHFFILQLDSIETSKFVLEKVISNTHIKRITVHGLHSMQEAYRTNELPDEDRNTFEEPGGYWVKRTLADAKLTVTDPDKYENKGLYVPIAKNFVDRMPSIDRSYLYQETLSVAVYAVTKTKVKWYQRGAFNWLITIATIVIAIFDGGYTAVTWAAIVSVATSVIVNLIIGRLVALGLEQVVDILGIENAAILAAVAAVVGFVTGRFNANMAAAWADDLLKTAMWGLQAVGNKLEDAFSTLMDESEAFFELLNEKYDEIEEIDKMLKGDTNIDYLQLQRRAQREMYIEDPSMFYYRTVHNPNPAVLSKNMIGTYVDRKLKLPDINELTKLFKKNT